MSTYLKAQVDVKKLIDNTLKVKKLINKNVKLCAVVKSNAYGHGIVNTSLILENFCDMFAVSIDKEVYDLRIGGIKKDILLLTPVYKENVEKLIKYNAILSVGTFKELTLINKYSKKLNKQVGIHIAVNSGMNRLGFDEESEVLRCVNYIKRNRNIKLLGAFSHLGCPENKSYSKSQFEIFLKLTRKIKEYNKNAILHILSSGGLILYKNMQLDMCRVGILLYGYTPFETSLIQVKPVMKVYSNLIVERNNLKNKRLLYGDSVNSIDRVDIIRLGYADGFKRVDTFKTNCCMDISAIEKTKGKNYKLVMDNAEVLAKRLHTISYEVLVNSTIRAEIVYKNYAYYKWKT